MLAPLTETRGSWFHPQWSTVDEAQVESQGASGRYRCPFVADFVEKLFEWALWLHCGECHFATQLILIPKIPRCETLFYRRRLPREAPDFFNKIGTERTPD